jgi:hypothetical protein
MMLQSDRFSLAMLGLAVVLGSTLAIAAPTQPAGGKASIAQQEDADPELVAAALQASPGDLGLSYLANRSLIRMADLVGGGIQIHTPQGVIDESSAAKQKQEGERRLRAYREAILQRGFENFSGTYKVASVTPSCADTGSLWLGGAVEGILEEYVFSQESFELVLSITPKIEPGTMDDVGTFDLEGVVVESAILIEDPFNSDYFIEGEGFGDRIELKPNLNVLKSWPKWAGPPKKRDLERCKLVLMKEKPE